MTRSCGDTVQVQRDTVQTVQHTPACPSPAHDTVVHGPVTAPVRRDGARRGRLSTVRRAHEMAVLERGRVAEIGTHQVPKRAPFLLL